MSAHRSNPVMENEIFSKYFIFQLWRRVCRLARLKNKGFSPKKLALKRQKAAFLKTSQKSGPLLDEIILRARLEDQKKQAANLFDFN